MNKLSRILISLLVIIMMACVVSADPITIDIVGFGSVHLDHLPSGGSSNRISDSELVLLFAQLNDYPGTGTMKLSFWNKDTQQLLYTNTMNVPACAGNCGWEYWNWWGFL